MAVLIASELRKEFAGDPLFDGVSFTVGRRDRLSLAGPNGAGKTTLLAAIVGEHPLDAGSVRLGHVVVLGTFSQHTHELPDQGTVLDAAIRATGLTRPQAQALLGRFLFSGWELHERQVGALSGGEHRRLALALLVASGANFLVLDEPTNHLDLESREALETALEAFPGTILLVSHDRALLDAVPDRIVAIEERTLRSYPGGWADLVREREAASAPPKTDEPRRERRPARSKPAPHRPSDLERVEARIADVEARVSDLEGELAEDWTNMDVLRAHRAARDELTALLEQWEELFDAAQRSSP